MSAVFTNAVRLPPLTLLLPPPPGDAGETGQDQQPHLEGATDGSDQGATRFPRDPRRVKPQPLRPPETLAVGGGGGTSGRQTTGEGQNVSRHREGVRQMVGKAGGAVTEGGGVMSIRWFGRGVHVGRL